MRKASSFTCCSDKIRRTRKLKKESRSSSALFAQLAMEETGLEESIFPVDIELKDIREAVQGRTDFREVTGPDYIIFIYFLGMAKDIFPDPATAPDQRTAYLWRLRRESRGIAFDPETGKVKSRRFHKFFNGANIPLSYTKR